MLRLTSASVSSISEIFQVSEDDCFAALCRVPSGFAYAPPKRTALLYQKTTTDSAAFANQMAETTFKIVSAARCGETASQLFCADSSFRM